MAYVPGEKKNMGDRDKSLQQSQRTREAVNGKTGIVVIPAYTALGNAGRMVFKDGVLVDYLNPT